MRTPAVPDRAGSSRSAPPPWRQGRGIGLAALGSAARADRPGRQRRPPPGARGAGQRGGDRLDPDPGKARRGQDLLDIAGLAERQRAGRARRRRVGRTQPAHADRRAAGRTTGCPRAGPSRRRRAGRPAAARCPRLAKAATGSLKNITPKRETSRSYAARSKRWIWASARRKRTLRQALRRAAPAGDASIGAERSIASTAPLGADPLAPAPGSWRRCRSRRRRTLARAGSRRGRSARR